MSDLKVGDIVTRKSYGGDILFKVVCINQNDNDKIVTLRGVEHRLEADAPESDLEVQPIQSEKVEKSQRPGKGKGKRKKKSTARRKKRPKKTEEKLPSESKEADSESPS